MSHGNTPPAQSQPPGGLNTLSRGVSSQEREEREAAPGQLGDPREAPPSARPSLLLALGPHGRTAFPVAAPALICQLAHCPRFLSGKWLCQFRAGVSCSPHPLHLFLLGTSVLLRAGDLRDTPSSQALTASGPGPSADSYLGLFSPGPAFCLVWTVRGPRSHGGEPGVPSAGQRARPGMSQRPVVSPCPGWALRMEMAGVV